MKVKIIMIKFDVEGPSLWNGLPEGLRRVRKVKDFGKRLRTSFLKNIELL